eukprot:2441859-Rhodomonas_salina.2
MGQTRCTPCPHENMITKNSTQRDSVGTCFCSAGHFRAAVIYRYNESYESSLGRTCDTPGHICVLPTHVGCLGLTQ